MHINELRLGDLFTTSETRLYIETGKASGKGFATKVHADQKFLYLGKSPGGWGFLNVKAILLHDEFTENKIVTFNVSEFTENKIVTFNVSERSEDFNLLERRGIFEVRMPDHSLWGIPRILLDGLYDEALGEVKALGILKEDGSLPDFEEYMGADADTYEVLAKVLEFPYSMSWSSLQPYAVRLEKPDTQRFYEEQWEEKGAWPQDHWKKDL